MLPEPEETLQEMKMLLQSKKKEVALNKAQQNMKLPEI